MGDKNFKAHAIHRSCRASVVHQDGQCLIALIGQQIDFG